MELYRLARSQPSLQAGAAASVTRIPEAPAARSEPRLTTQISPQYSCAVRLLPQHHRQSTVAAQFDCALEFCDYFSQPTHQSLHHRQYRK